MRYWNSPRERLAQRCTPCSRLGSSSPRSAGRTQSGWFPCQKNPAQNPPRRSRCAAGFRDPACSRETSRPPLRNRCRSRSVCAPSKIRSRESTDELHSPRNAARGPSRKMHWCVRANAPARAGIQRCAAWPAWGRSRDHPPYPPSQCAWLAVRHSGPCPRRQPPRPRQ